MKSQHASSYFISIPDTFISDQDKKNYLLKLDTSNKRVINRSKRGDKESSMEKIEQHLNFPTLLPFIFLNIN